MSRVASGNSRSARAAHGAPRCGAGLRSSRQQVAGGAAQCQQPKANPPEGLEPDDAQAGNNPDRGGKQGDVQGRNLARTHRRQPCLGAAGNRADTAYDCCCDADPEEPGSRVRFRSHGRCRLLSLRQPCGQPVSGSCRPKPRFVADWFRDCPSIFHIEAIRTFVLRGIPMCCTSLPSSGCDRRRLAAWPVNQRKQIRNTNEHFAKSRRNMPQR